MNRLLFLFSCMLIISQCSSQLTEVEQKISLTEKYVRSILTDSTNKWSEYPKPPALTAEVMDGLSKELEDDSAKYYFEQLSIGNMKSHQVYRRSLTFFENFGKTFCMLSMAAHWNPDARLEALKALNKRKMIRPLICTTTAGYDALEKEDYDIVKFMIYLLEGNPLFINGSENSTIHGFYISNICLNLDLYTGENLTGGKLIYDWYKNESQYQSILRKWKVHSDKTK